MKKLAEQLSKNITDYSDKLTLISAADFLFRTSPEKWSRKEELGHLIDSAQNNLRRFIVAQYELNPKIVYDQNFWVSANAYRDQTPARLITFWKALNIQIVEVFMNMPEENYQCMCDTGKSDVELHSLKFLAEDYIKHMLHHLHHLLRLEPIAY